MPGEIFVISAPSGTGKSTLLRELLIGDPRLQFSLSYTTRPPRPQEVHGKDYFFVSPEEFHHLKEEGELVEWVESFGHLYGTSRRWVMETLARDVDVVFDIDTRGARSLKADFPQGVLIFILPPSLPVLEERLRARGKLPPEELASRLRQGRQELREVFWYDFLVVNEYLPTALEQLRAIISATRCRVAHVWPHLAARFED